MDIEKFRKKMNELPLDVEITQERLEDVAKRSAKRLGCIKTSVVCMEEAAELQQAISKKIRGKSDLVSDYNLIEEIADVICAISSVMYIYDITPEEVTRAMKIKLDRIEEKNEEYFNNEVLK